MPGSDAPRGTGEERPGLTPRQRSLLSHLKRFADLAPERSRAEYFILENGTFFHPAPLPRGVRRGPAKQCFANAEKLSSDRNWDYAEGHAATEGEFPFLHAWCIDGDAAIDPTLQAPNQYAYLGVVIRRPLLGEILNKQRYFGVLGGEFLDLFIERWRHSGAGG